MKSTYNERFTFPDPLTLQSASRTTRYRAKRRRMATEEESLASTSSASPVCSFIEDGQTDYVEESRQFQDPDSGVYDFTTYPQSLETEILPAETLSDYHSDDEEPEHSSPTTPSVLSTEPLYEGSSLTVPTSSVLIMKYALRHKLTQEALADLLRLVKLHCPSPNQCPSSLYKFNKQFRDLHYPIVLHHFCSACLHVVEVESSEMGSKMCTNPHCNCDLSAQNSVSSFIEVPVDSQLKTLLERDGIFTTILKRFNLRKGQDGCYTDIYDGKVYQQLVSTGFLANGTNISLMFNSDGIPVFRSSGFAFWPLYLLINELPYRIRHSKENRILAGLWYGSIKPDMTLFLKPMVQSLKKLYNEGISVSPPGHDSIVCYVALLCTTCDLPAKAMLLNFVQFNGFYGCSRCLQKGETLHLGERSHTHVYPYNEVDPCGPTRTHLNTCQHMEDASASSSPVFGVKGPSWLCVIPGFDVIDGVSTDYMHCVLLGVCRLLLRLWLQSCHHKELWYIGNQLSLLDDRLCRIKPPDEIQRTPRSMAVTLKFWKAHELRAWLLHYSPAVLHGILPDSYYQHHLLLVEGVFLLMKEQVSGDDVSQSSQLLQHYCLLFSPLYGERYMSINIHSLLHLPETVKNLGPLWAHSCFAFEAANGELLNLFHGSQAVEKQVVNHISALHKMPSLASYALPPSSQQEDLYKRMNHTGRYSSLEQQIMISCSKVRDKCVLMDLTTNLELVFVSCFPNTIEVD